MVKFKAATAAFAAVLILLTSIAVHAKIIDRIAAVVNDEVITEAEVNRRLAAKEVSGKENTDASMKAQRRMVIEWPSICTRHVISQTSQPP